MKIEDAVEFIRMEYAEMPGLKLTFWQLQRLLRLSLAPTCADQWISPLLEKTAALRRLHGRNRRDALRLSLTDTDDLILVTGGTGNIGAALIPAYTDMCASRPAAEAPPDVPSTIAEPIGEFYRVANATPCAAFAMIAATASG